MTLVDPAYRNEFAVLATWLSALLPWSVWWLSGSVGVVEIRFPVVVARFVTDAPDPVRTPYFFARLNEGNASGLGYTVALLGALVFALALVASVELFLREERLDDLLPRTPAFVLGGLLTVSGLAFAGATYLLSAVQPGLTVPLGVLFQVGFGAILLSGEQSP
ncbi:DUF7549 family protein [Halomarina litorea]|uniref:DUF7549 family protein n=1 Tax=Halomarina litorea TaxID=2961595 RepID=UPI0020C36D70|nr:hypothetical protein [Halomarina sp. BCD28]